MTWTRPDDASERELLTTVRSVAVVGVSDKPGRASFDVSRYLLDHTDYHMHFVNPRITEVFDHPVYPSLAALPAPVDLVVVFRRAEDLPEVLADARAANARNLWIQLGIINQEVADDAHDAGMGVVMDSCIMVEHMRLIGRSS